MATTDSDLFVSLYTDRIGIPSTDEEVYGYWLFALGLFIAITGIALVVPTDAGEFLRGVGLGLSGVGLVLLLTGPVIRLPLQRSARRIAYLGALLGITAVTWFFGEFAAGRWTVDFEYNEVWIISLYGLGIVLIAAGSVLTPLATGTRESQTASSPRVGKTDETTSDTAAREAQKRAEVAERKARKARQQVRQLEREMETTARERAEREALEQEFRHIATSQSQFELYTDSAGEHRWRLRHRNRNVVADSGQGYASRQKARQGLGAVKRNALGAAVVDLDALDEAEDDRPALVGEGGSDAAFEHYRDEMKRHRWRLRDGDGGLLAESGRGYPREDSRDDAVESVRHYAQVANYLHVDPAAFARYRDQTGEYGWRLLSGDTVVAESARQYDSAREADESIARARESATADGAEVEIEEDGGEFRWRLRHADGALVATAGETHASRAGVRDALGEFRQCVAEASVQDGARAAFEIYQDGAGEYRWQLRHCDGSVLATAGQSYPSADAAERSVTRVKYGAPGASRASGPGTRA